jgi:hypothetical protein
MDNLPVHGGAFTDITSNTRELYERIARESELQAARR